MSLTVACIGEWVIAGEISISLELHDEFGVGSVTKGSHCFSDALIHAVELDAQFGFSSIGIAEEGDTGAVSKGLSGLSVSFTLGAGEGVVTPSINTSAVTIAGAAVTSTALVVQITISPPIAATVTTDPAATATGTAPIIPIRLLPEHTGRGKQIARIVDIVTSHTRKSEGELIGVSIGVVGPLVGVS